MSDESPAADVMQDFNQLRADMSRLSDTVAELVKTQTKAATSTLTDSLSQGGEKISAKISQLGDNARQASDQAQASVRSASHDLEATINHNPVTAVLLAAGVGLIFGILSARN